MVADVTEESSFNRYPFELSDAAESRAQELHRSVIIVDMLFQGPCGSRSFDHELSEDLRKRWDSDRDAIAAWNYITEAPARQAVSPGGFSAFERCWRESGITAGTRERDFATERDILEGCALARAQFSTLDWLEEATTAEVIRAAKRDGKMAAFINSQDTLGFGTDLTLFDAAHALGLRMVGLTYNSANFVGNGCTERGDGGLTHFGVKVVDRLNSLGVIIDTSHCGRQTTLDACHSTKKPLVASHTAAERIYDIDRAKSDDELRAIAATGGVVGICAVPFFLTHESDATIEHMLDHVDYIANLIGVDHTGIGTDWPLQMPKWALTAIVQPWAQAAGFRAEHGVDWTRSLAGFEDYRDFPNITRGLVNRGYSDSEIHAILGENFLRVLDDAVY
jgi:membrane dipeptidase